MMRTEHTELEGVLDLLDVCQRRLKKDSQDVDAWFSKGLALAKLRKYEQAIYCLNRVTRIQRNYPSVWRLKAKVYALIGDRRMSSLCRRVARRFDVEERVSSVKRITSLRAV